MSFSLLALVVLVGLLGPVLVGRSSWHLPVVVGELLGGILIGASGLRLIDAGEPTFTALANIGFALTMFVVGSHIPVRDQAVRSALGRGAVGAVLAAVVAVAAGLAIAALFGTGHPALYAVLIASSSAALVLPIAAAIGLTGPSSLQLVAQVAIADTLCIVALPLAIDPANSAPAALGALAVMGIAVLAFFGLLALDRLGLRQRGHKLSERRKFALELRISLLLLFALAGLAQLTHVSIMLAGFALGLVVAAIGEPRRLARQLFAVTDGFFGPLFFVWLGASIQLSHLAAHPLMILLGVCLGAAAIVAHLAVRLVGQPLLLGVMAAGQLGVPVAAATLGTQLHLLRPGEDAALLLGALVTVAATTVAGSLRARRTAGPTDSARPGVPAE
ncbi:cation:proton antiporter [Lacisediminihabitans profunda]|uniref:Cation:proton antiporter n=1 Tax=Lacisediminihabitans profunda TaxID=2594790 RepID=A0A5C8UVD1_9MICO|nr:cation:proton antiporter [Lacisediminihabitans profunda]TXN31972.1 cation:proton antiporter [Lacisediminihabitans profunda]